MYEEIINAISEGNLANIIELVRSDLNLGNKPQDIIQKGLIAGMDLVSDRWRRDEIFIPEVLLSARTMKLAMEELKPLLLGEEKTYVGHVLIGTVKGDLHDIGKNLVKMMLEGAGLQVTDLGVDVSPEKFAEAIEQTGADILAMSSLLTTTMGMMGKTIQVLDKKGLRSKVKILVGGPCISENFAQEIGADAYGRDANVAVELCRKFSNKNSNCA